MAWRRGVFIGVVLVAACSPAAVAPLPVTTPLVSAQSSLGPSAAPTSAPATPSATAVPALDATDPGVGWESRFVFMEDSGLGPIGGLIAGGPGYVMWSTEPSGQIGFVLTTDGASYSQVDSTLRGRVLIDLVAARGDLVGLATHGSGPIERWSSADGSAWDVIATSGIDGTPAALVRTSSGYVSVGRDRSACGLASWTSPDARLWTLSGVLASSGTCSGTAPPIHIGQLLAGPTGLLAWGELAGAGATVWTSTDGRSWQAHPGPSIGHVVRMTRGGSGYVAVGDDGQIPAGAATWTSPDGIAWTPASPQSSFTGATMSAVVSLADGRLVAVGSQPSPTGPPQPVAWTSSDGSSWQRSPAPLCQDVDVCDRGFDQGLLATDGRHLAAYGHGLNVLVSPPITVGLRVATLALGFDGNPEGPWTSGSVVGFCAPPDGSPGGGHALAYGAAYANHPTIVFNPWSSGIASLQLEVGADGSIVGLGYDRGDGAGFMGRATDVGPGEFSVDGDHVSVDAGSSAAQGRLEFRRLPVSRGDPSLPPVSPVSGSLTWSCG